MRSAAPGGRPSTPAADHRCRGGTSISASMPAPGPIRRRPHRVMCGMIMQRRSMPASQRGGERGPQAAGGAVHPGRGSRLVPHAAPRPQAAPRRHRPLLPGQELGRGLARDAGQRTNAGAPIGNFCAPRWMVMKDPTPAPIRQVAHILDKRSRVVTIAGRDPSREIRSIRTAWRRIGMIIRDERERAFCRSAEPALRAAPCGRLHRPLLPMCARRAPVPGCRAAGVAACCSSGR